RCCGCATGCRSSRTFRRNSAARARPCRSEARASRAARVMFPEADLDSHLVPTPGDPLQGLPDPNLANYLTLPPRTLLEGLQRPCLDAGGGEPGPRDFAEPRRLPHDWGRPGF